MLGLLLTTASIPAFDQARCSHVSERATRFIQAYHDAPDVGFLAKVALGVMKSSEAGRTDQTCTQRKTS